MIEKFSNGEKITSQDWKKIDFLVEKLEISLHEAIELREFDKYESNKQDDHEKAQKLDKAQKPKKGITQDEIIDLFQNVISIAFKEKEFNNKDFHKLVADKLSNRQTPSRLKKMVENGLLIDLGGSPKKYKIK